VVDNPLLITGQFIAVLMKAEKMRQSVVEQIVLAFLPFLQDHPSHIAAVIEVMRSQKRKGERVLLDILRDNNTFHDLAVEVDDEFAELRRK
jgi:hypothetical protein